MENGNLVKEAAERYLKAVLHADSLHSQRRVLRRTFYAGAMEMFKLLDEFRRLNDVDAAAAWVMVENELDRIAFDAGLEMQQKIQRNNGT